MEAEHYSEISVLICKTLHLTTPIILIFINIRRLNRTKCSSSTRILPHHLLCVLRIFYREGNWQYLKAPLFSGKESLICSPFQLSAIKFYLRLSISKTPWIYIVLGSICKSVPEATPEEEKERGNEHNKQKVKWYRETPQCLNVI